MYLKFIDTEHTSDALFLMAYHLFRSRPFREVLRKPDDKLQEALNKLVKEDIYSEMVKAIVFLIYSPPVQLCLDEVGNKSEVEYYNIMKKGFKCILYRSDGSCKEAKVDIDEEYSFRAYKYPDGEVKKKYCVNIRHIREFQLEFQKHPELWKRSVFASDKGMFESHKADQKCCCTIVSNSKWGEISLISLEFSKAEEKYLFFKCLSYLLAIFRL